MTEADLIGRLLYQPLNQQFFQIVRFEEPYEFIEEAGRAMILKSLATDHEDPANWRQDIGDEYKLVSAEFPIELAIEYSQISNRIRGDLNQMDNILSHPEFEFEEVEPTT
ncbi:MAG: hypothetical protein AAF478_10175 [Pseudomonadota bacterium]